MQIVRFVSSDIDNRDPYQSGAQLGLLKALSVVIPLAHTSLGDLHATVRQGLEPVQSQAPPIPLSDLHLLPPSAPSKIVCVGLNYRHHAEEMNKPIPAEPLIFLKAPSALLSPMEPIILPDASALVHHEGEMAVVIGQRTCRVTEAEAMGCILGVTCMNDVTARDIQRREGGRYSRAKGFDTFAPCGPSLTLGVDPNDLEVSCAVNGHVRQRSSTRDLIFSVETVIAFVSSIMTLMPGDIISTGTPSGVGPLVDGDHVSVEVSGVGVLNNPVKALQ